MSEESREAFRTRTRIVRYLRDFPTRLDFLESRDANACRRYLAAPSRVRSSHITTHSICRCSLRIAPELYLKRLGRRWLRAVVYEINRNFLQRGLST